jgi:hypothetical protein
MDIAVCSTRLSPILAVTLLECKWDWNQLIARTVICVVDVGFTILGMVKRNLLFLIIFLFVFPRVFLGYLWFSVKYTVMSLCLLKVVLSCPCGIGVEIRNLLQRLKEKDLTLFASCCRSSYIYGDLFWLDFSPKAVWEEVVVTSNTVECIVEIFLALSRAKYKITLKWTCENNETDSERNVSWLCICRMFQNLEFR